MTASDSPDKTRAETVIPDYCNTGLIFRALFAVNAAILVTCVVRANNVMNGLLGFVEASMLVEWASLTSIFLLCGLRRLLLSTGYVSLFSPWTQRLLCVTIPALVTGLLIRFLQPYDWFRYSFGYLAVADGVLLAVLFAIVLQHYFELRARAFSPALAEARLQSLQARIHPHFLFNSLNAVLSLIRREPLRAETALEDMAELFRASMRDGRAMSTLDEEIRLCQQYLSLEKIRLGERLQVRWDLSGISEDDLHTAQVATLMLQPLIENAVIYGVEPSQEPTLIEVRIGCARGTVDIQITNPLPPSSDDALATGGNRMALGNIRERLALLYDVEAQLSSQAVDGRFVVRLRFPIRGGRA